MTTSLSIDGLTWPSPVAVPVERVLEGSPETSTLILHAEDGTEAGLWQVTRGAFTTVHHGYTEIVVIIRGEGDLVRDDGSTFPLYPGAVIVLEDGWSGRWVIRRDVTKSYAIVSRT
jgi:uncharacterized protein